MRLTSLDSEHVEHELGNGDPAAAVQQPGLRGRLSNPSDALREGFRLPLLSRRRAPPHRVRSALLTFYRDRVRDAPHRRLSTGLAAALLGLNGFE